MDAKHTKAHDLIVQAREALRRGDKPAALDLAEQTALLVPDMEDAWLVLAAAEPDPQDALAYARKALELNPDSARAHKAVQWASGRVNQAPAGKEAVSPPPARIQSDSASSIPRPIPAEKTPQAKPKPTSRRWLFVSALGLLVCAVFAVAAWTAFTNPVFASVFEGDPVPTQEDLWVNVDVPKPSVTPIDGSAFSASTSIPTLPPPTASRTPEPTDEPTLAVSDTPTSVPTDAPSETPAVTETPGEMAMEIVPDTPTSAYVAPTYSPPNPSLSVSGGTRWIDVDLTNQRVYAYEGETLVNSFLVSTGTWLTPTVTGKYSIYVKYRTANMHGPGYFLPDVPYVMYFYKGYGLHGTYWHNNFGTPMSHGCVNLATGDAGWLYNWASVGTVVNVHY